MTQLDQVRKQLEDFGFVSRNWCLQNFNTRLGARINDLKKEGWEFTPKSVKTANGGKDFVYYVKSKPSTGIESPTTNQTPLVGLNLPSQTTYKSHYE